MRRYSVFFFAVLFSFHIQSIFSQASIDVETGIVNTGYNNVRIPGNGGTLFSLKNDLKANSDIYYRIRVNYSVNSHSSFSLLFAPLTIKSEGLVADILVFAGKTFPANAELKGIYKFNSYRLTYRYDFWQKPKFNFGLGITAKIRDARIAITSEGIASEKANIGFVPIINFRLYYKFKENLGLLFEGDALVAKQGRAEDIQIAALYKYSAHLAFRAGYRVLEGGSDGDKVYGFALFHYASIGILLAL